MHYFLTLRADCAAEHYTSRKDALAAARRYLGGRVYQSHDYRVDDGEAVSLYGTATECRSDQDGAHAVRLTWNKTGVRP